MNFGGKAPGQQMPQQGKGQTQQMPQQGKGTPRVGSNIMGGTVTPYTIGPNGRPIGGRAYAGVGKGQRPPMNNPNMQGKGKGPVPNQNMPNQGKGSNAEQFYQAVGQQPIRQQMPMQGKGGNINQVGPDGRPLGAPGFDIFAGMNKPSQGGMGGQPQQMPMQGNNFTQQQMLMQGNNFTQQQMPQQFQNRIDRMV